MIERTFSIDMHSSGAVPSGVYINQANLDTVTFNFKIFDSAEEIDYTEFDSARIVLSKDNKGILNSPCVLDMSNKLIRYRVEPEALGRVGRITGQIELAAGDRKILATSYFDFFVFGSLSSLTEAEKRVFVNDIEELIKTLESNIDMSNEAADVLVEAKNLLEITQSGMIVSVGDVETVTLDSEASAEVDILTLEGNRLDFLFKIPRGQPGAQGPQGVQGQKGDTGRGMFYLEQEDGKLYFIADTGVENPFEYDEQSGNLYYEVK